MGSVVRDSPIVARRPDSPVKVVPAASTLTGGPPCRCRLVTNRPDKPHDPTFIRFLPSKMNSTTSALNGLRHFRVYRRWQEVYTVDVIAPNSDEALCLADKMDLKQWRFFTSGWGDDRADSMAYDQFEPPDLPASAWATSSRTSTNRETALSAISPTLQ